VVILGGGRTPFVVRPCPGPSCFSPDGFRDWVEKVVVNEYWLVGESYFYGMMDGEMVAEGKAPQQMYNFR
jgi:hypothetical protein